MSLILLIFGLYLCFHDHGFIGVVLILIALGVIVE